MDDLLPFQPQIFCQLHTTYYRQLSVFSGDPQGNVLGPILFTVYTNDMLVKLVNSHVSCYVDDRKLFTDPLANHILQNHLSTVEKWCKKLLLALSASKCRVLHIGSENARKS